MKPVIETGKAYLASRRLVDEMHLLVHATDMSNPVTVARVERCEAEIKTIVEAFGYAMYDPDAVPVQKRRAA